MSTTYQEPIVRIADNPLLIAQAQRQLHQKQLTMSLFIAGSLSFVITLICYQLTQTSSFMGSQPAQSIWLGGQKFFYFILFFALYWRGTSSLVHTISEERKSGILTFLRSTPLSPYSLTIGYLLGVNIRGYCVSGVIAPFWIGSSMMAGIKPIAAIVSYLYLVLGAFTIHALVLAFMLHTSGKTQKWGSLIFVAGLWFIAIPCETAGLHTLSHLTPIPVLMSLADKVQIFDLSAQPIPVFGTTVGSELFTLIVQSIAISISLWISARRLERDDQAVMSRTGALIAMAVITLLLISSDLNPSSRRNLTRFNYTTTFGIVTQITCLIFACYIALISAPSRLSFIRAARRQTQTKSSTHNSRISWHAEGGSLLQLSCILIGLSTLISMTFFLVYGVGNTSLSSLTTNVNFLLSIFSNGIFLLFFSGVCEYIKSHAHKLNQGLALLTTLVTFFLLPMILALAFKEPQIYAMSPAYMLVYSFSSLVTSTKTHILSTYDSDLFNITDYTISLIITVSVTIIAYIQSSAIRSQDLKSQLMGDGDAYSDVT